MEIVRLYLEIRGQEVIGGHRADEELRGRCLDISQRDYSNCIGLHRQVVCHMKHDYRLFSLFGFYTFSLDKPYAGGFEDFGIHLKFSLDYNAAQPVGYLEAQWLSANPGVCDLKCQLPSSDSTCGCLFCCLACPGEKGCNVNHWNLLPFCCLFSEVVTCGLDSLIQGFQFQLSDASLLRCSDHQ